MRAIFIFCISFIIVGCINDSEQDKTHLLSFPLEVGKNWEYESIIKYDDSTIGTSLHLFTSITTQLETQSLYPVYKFKDSLDGDPTYDYYENRPDGIYLYASTPGGYHTLFKKTSLPLDVALKTPPVLLAPNSFKDGEEWVYDSLIDNESNLKKPLKRSYVGMQEVITKAGVFNCYKFETTGYSNEKRIHYYCPDIGLVMKEEIIDEFGITSSNFEVIRYVRYLKRDMLIATN